MPSQRNFCSRVEFAEVFVKDADGTFTAPLTGHKDKVAIGAGEEVSAAVVLGVGGNLVPQIVPLLRFFDVSGGGVTSSPGYCPKPLLSKRECSTTVSYTHLPITGWHSLFLQSYTRTPFGIPYGLLTCHWQEKYGLTTFRASNL